MGSDETAHPSSSLHRDSKRMKIAARDRGAVFCGRGYDAEGDRIATDNEFCAPLASEFAYLRRLAFDQPEIRGILQEDSRGAASDFGAQIIGVDQPCLWIETNLFDNDIWLQVVRHHQPGLGVHRARDDNFSAPRQTRCHPHRGGGGLSSVVERAAQYVHIKQFAHETAVLKESLPLAVVCVRFPHVRGKELASSVNLVAHGGNKVLCAASAQEVEVILAVVVLFEQAFDVSS